MDQPGLDEARHAHALHGLARINLWSLTSNALFGPIARLARDIPGRELNVLDLASGGGDVAVGLWRKARRHGIPLRIRGCDVNPRAVEFARRRAHSRRADVGFFVLDAVNGPLPEGYDVLICSLFLHHLDENEAVALLRRMSAAAAHLVAVDDLRRHPAGAALAALGTRILTRSDVVHVDGLRSVRAAFTIGEASQLARTSDLHGFVIRPHWPFRFLLTWRKTLIP